MAETNYISTNRSKHYLKCHLVFCIKYRKKLLVGELKTDMYQILNEIALKSSFELEVFESDLDHIHFLVRYIPRLSVTSIVRKLKQVSTIRIWQIHEKQLTKVFTKERTFWSDGYFVCSVGEPSEDTVREYILNQ